MTTQLNGSVKMAGDNGVGVEVQIHLEEETLALVSFNGSEIGRWSLDQVGISSRPDGFHLRLEGEEIVLRTEDDARFALALGVTTPTNRLARQMARLRDEASAQQITVDLTDGYIPPPIPQEQVTSRRSSRLAEGLPSLGPLVVVAATVAVIASIVAIASGSAISFTGNIPAWPAMTAASLVMAAGGFAAFQNPTNGRAVIAIGIGIGLVTILFSAGRLSSEGLASEALLAFTLATVVSGVLLAVDTAGRSYHD
ncbi:MAG: hypothetical protein WB239_14535 [Acidimicrobiia bacterium]